MSKKYISRKSLVHGKKLKDLKVWILEFITQFYLFSRHSHEEWCLKLCYEGKKKRLCLVLVISLYFFIFIITIFVYILMRLSAKFLHCLSTTCLNYNFSSIFKPKQKNTFDRPFIFVKWSQFPYAVLFSLICRA